MTSPRDARVSFWRGGAVLAPSVAEYAVDLGCQRLPCQEAPRVGDEYLRDTFIARRVQPPDVRQHDDTLGCPERVIGGQGLLAEHVKHRAGDGFRPHCLDQIRI